MGEEKFDPARIPAAIAKAEHELDSDEDGPLEWLEVDGVYVSRGEVALAKALWEFWHEQWEFWPEEIEKVPPALRAFAEKVEALG